MDRKFIGQWALALMSGKYVQGRSCLANLHESVIAYCCLGVACAISKLPMRVTQAHSIMFLTENEHGEVQASDSFLPDALRKKYGIVASDPSLVITSEHDKALLKRIFTEMQKEKPIPMQVAEYEITEWLSAPMALSKMNDRGIPFPIIAQMILRYL